MDSSHAMTRSTEFPTKLLLSVFLLCSLLLVPPSVGHASDLTVVEGVVESVSGTVIHLRGKTYDIGKSRISNSSGKELPLADITRGRKVNLFVVKGKIANVVISPTGLVE